MDLKRLNLMGSWQMKFSREVGFCSGHSVVEEKIWNLATKNGSYFSVTAKGIKHNISSEQL